MLILTACFLHRRMKRIVACALSIPFASTAPPVHPVVRARLHREHGVPKCTTYPYAPAEDPAGDDALDEAVGHAEMPALRQLAAQRGGTSG